MARGVQVGDKAPDFTLPSQTGEPVLQPDRFAGLRREGEVGSLVTDLNAACHTRQPLCVPP